MRLPLVLTSLLFILSLTLKAQKILVTGQVYDEKIEESLPFAQVAISDIKGEECMSGALTDSLGVFSIAITPNKTYKIIVQYLGYESFEKQIDTFTEHINLGKIKLNSSAHDLQEIFVTAEKKSIGKENGNWVLYPDKLPEGGNNSAIELLSSIPSVAVDMDDAINIRGREASILIDGVKIDDQSELDQISPSAIAKIEVIQNPSAKYDADGSVINIQLKAPILSSSSSNLKASVDHFGNHQENFSTNKKHKNWGGFLQANSNINQFDSEIDVKRKNLLSGSPFLNQLKKQSMKNNKQQIRAGLNHRLSIKHLFKIDVQLQNHQTDPSIFTHKDILNLEEELTKYTEQNQNIEKEKITQQYRAHYIGKWENETLKVRLNHRRQNQWDNRHLENMNFYPNGDAYSNLPAIKKDDIDWVIRNYQIKIDYQKSITSSTTLEAGADWKYEEQTQTACQEKFKHDENRWEINPAKTFDYQYSRRNVASYGIVEIKKENWFLIAGSRFRFIELSTNNAREEVTSNQYNFYPSVLPTVNIGKNWQQSDLSFSYKKSQKLPRSAQLNSFKNDANPLNIQFGNPDLKPEKEHSFSLDYSVQKENFQLGIALFHRMIQDVVMQQYYTHGDTLFRSFNNMAKQFVTGNEYTFNFKPTKWCRLNGSSTLYKQKFTGKNLSLGKKKIWSYNFKLGGQFQLPKNLNMMVNYNYNSETLTANGVKSNLYNLDLAFSRDFLNKRLKISMKGINLLDSKNQWTDVENLQFTARNRRYQDNRRLIVGVVYKWSHKN